MGKTDNKFEKAMIIKEYRLKRKMCVLWAATRYGNGLDLINHLFTIAKQDFPKLREDKVSVKSNNDGDQFHIEFKAKNDKVPGSYGRWE